MFLSQQVKQNSIITNKNGKYELTDELPNDVKAGIYFRNFSTDRKNNSSETWKYFPRVKKILQRENLILSRKTLWTKKLWKKF